MSSEERAGGSSRPEILAADSGGSESNLTAVRPNIVNAARSFMANPATRSAPIEVQKKFLAAKGVTEIEFEEARKGLPLLEAGLPHRRADIFPVSSPVKPIDVARVSPFGYSDGLSSQTVWTQHKLQTNNWPSSQIPQNLNNCQKPTNRLVQLLNYAIVIGGVSYAGYRFLRSVILPRYFRIPDPAREERRQLQTQLNELQNSVKFVMDSVELLTKIMSQQGELLNKACVMLPRSSGSDLEEDVRIIKSLLLSQNQLASLLPRQALRASSASSSFQQKYTLTTDKEDLTNGSHFDEEDGEERNDEDPTVPNLCDA